MNRSEHGLAYRLVAFAFLAGCGSASLRSDATPDGTATGQGGADGSDGSVIDMVTAGSGGGGAVGTGGVGGTGGGGSGSGGTSICTNTMTDAANCGRCGHDCLGGICELGVCQPATLATGRGLLTVVALDAGYAYFGGNNVAIGRVPKAGGTVVSLTSELTASHWAMAGNRLYWVPSPERRDMQSCALPDCAGGVSDAGVGAFNYFALVADPSGANLYWAALDPAPSAYVIQGMTVASGTKRTLLTGVLSYGLAADGSYVYFSTSTAMLIEKMSITGTVRATLAVSPTGPSLVAACGTHLYWVDGANVYTTPLPDGTGSAPVPAFGNSSQNILGLACDDSGVYWTNFAVGSTQSGTVVTCPHTGCGDAPKVLALGQDRPRGIATDAVAVYWVSQAGGVLKVAK